MNEIDWVKSLDRDRNRDVPDLDIAPRVTRSIRQRQPQESETVYPLAALLATIAGAAAVAIAVPVWMFSQEPLIEFAGAFQMVLQ